MVAWLRRVPLCILLILFWACSRAPAQGGQAPPPPEGGLVLTVLDVGQGDAVLIESPAGKRVLVDGGPPESGRTLLGKLQRRGVSQLDLILLTHPHLDHLGGLAGVVRALPVKNFMDSGFPSESPAYLALLRALEEQKVPVRKASAGRKVDLGGGAELLLLGPPEPFLQRSRSDANANSVVARLRYGSQAAMLSGDAEPDTEQWLLQRGGELQADLLKVAHHGSRFSSGAPWLQAVRPRLALISVGRGNDYGHPTPAALERLAAVGARVYRTDQQGDLSFRCDGRAWHPLASTGAAAAPTAPAAPPPPPAREAAPAPVQEVVASERSDRFHKPSCPAVARMRPENLLRFADRAAALQSGRQPALDCHP